MEPATARGRFGSRDSPGLVVPVESPLGSLPPEPEVFVDDVRAREGELQPFQFRPKEMQNLFVEQRQQERLPCDQLLDLMVDLTTNLGTRSRRARSMCASISRVPHSNPRCPF